MSALTLEYNGQKVAAPIDDAAAAVAATAFAQIRVPQTHPLPDVPTTTPLRLFDNGLKNTVVCRSAVCHLDTTAGKVYYRGYDLEDLLERSTFLEVAYLLIYGQLPPPRELAVWTRYVMHHTYVHTELERQLETFRYDAHPMGVLISTMASLSTFHPEANPALRGASLYAVASAGDAAPRERAVDVRNKQIYRILGKSATIAAAAYRIRIGRPLNPPKKTTSYLENLLYMTDRLNEGLDWAPDLRLVRIFDQLFILMADSGSSCSTVTMRHLASSGVDPYSATAGALGALFGERKSAQVIEMLRGIGAPSNVPEFLATTGSQPSGGRRIMGFGHRIYRASADPRAAVARRIALKIHALVGETDPLFETALALEEAAASDPACQQRRLSPNIDYWLALSFHMLGFPPDMGPVLTGLPRIAGFLAHWIESLEDSDTKIYRPRQVYVGSGVRAYEPLDKRAETGRPAPALKPTRAPACFSRTLDREFPRPVSL